jgi:hypothetical protein
MIPGVHNYRLINCSVFIMMLYPKFKGVIFMIVLCKRLLTLVAMIKITSILLPLFFFRCIPSISDNTTDNTTDSVKPIITLKGDNSVTIKVNQHYTELGATATDNLEGDITSKIQIISSVDTSKGGTYSVIYIVSDKAGNGDNKQRKVIVTPKVLEILKPWPNQELVGSENTNIIVRHEKHTVQFIGPNDCKYSIDTGKTWKDMKKVSAVNREYERVDTNYDCKVFSWNPAADSLEGKTAYIKVQQYNQPEVFDQLGPLIIY